MMNQEIKRQWIEALRSGQYPQGFGRLRTPQGYCCLGVLEDLFLKSTLALPPDVVNRSVPSNACALWAGLIENDLFTVHIEGRPSSNLIYLNDLERRTLGEIADLLEADHEF